MNRISFNPLSLRLLAGGAFVLLAGACNDPFSLGPANISNRVDSTLIYALSMADIGEPAAYNMVERRSAVTEAGDLFDFVFDFDDDGAAVLIPLGALGLTVGAGLQHTEDRFDEINEPPTRNYVTDAPTVVTVGDVLIGRSRASTSGCGFLGRIARYGKFRVISIDRAAGTISLELLVNANCAFRNLEPGIPTQ